MGGAHATGPPARGPISLVFIGMHTDQPKGVSKVGDAVRGTASNRTSRRKNNDANLALVFGHDSPVLSFLFETIILDTANSRKRWIRLLYSSMGRSFRSPDHVCDRWLAMKAIEFEPSAQLTLQLWYDNLIYGSSFY